MKDFYVLPLLPSFWKSLKHLAGLFVRWQPLTFRGLLVLGLSIYALHVWAIPQADLIAAMLGGCLGALCTLMLLVSLLLRLHLGRRLKVEAFFEADNPLSRQNVPAGLACTASSIPPFFLLRIKRQFQGDGVFSPIHIIKGRSTTRAKRHLIDSVVFPHRGLWVLKALNLALEDSFGFCRIKWSMPLDARVEVSAPKLPIQPLPVMAASSRVGDQWNQSTERSGDLFDLRSYDPSDGIKRILWKTYAKSRQLVVRRPEPAMIPEGEVALYLIAKKEDDHVAGAALSYIDELHQHQITVLFGTDGAAHAASDPSTAATEISAAGPYRFFSTQRDIQRAINYSVWSEDTGSGAGFETFIEDLRAANRVLHNVIVFAVTAGESEAENRTGSWFSRLSAAAQRHHVKLSVALVPPPPALTVPTQKAPAAGGKLPQSFYTAARRLPHPVRKLVFPDHTPDQGRMAAVQASKMISAGAELMQVQFHE